jgi:hypothetical protein
VAKESPIERLRPTSVIVRRGLMRRRGFFIDTGIR